MDVSKKVIHLSLLFVCSVTSGTGFAGKCSGTNVNNLVSWDSTEIAKGTTLAVMRITSVTVSDDPGAPDHLVSGECVGSFLTTPDGKMQGSGSCARRDKDGDVLNEEWVSTDGTGSKGTSKNVGGTGKFAKAAGTAQWARACSKRRPRCDRFLAACDRGSRA